MSVSRLLNAIPKAPNLEGETGVVHDWNDAGPVFAANLQSH